MIEKKSDRTFSQLVILDPIILSPSQWTKLAGNTNSLYYCLRQEEAADGISQDGLRLVNLIKLNRSNEGEINTILKESDAIITCWTPIPDDLILSNSNLSYIGFWTHCIDGKINMKLAEDNGIAVTYIPNYGTDAVAELTIAGILTIGRKIPRITKDTLNGRWEYEYLKIGTHVPDFKEISTESLTGKLLGIVGFGRIGQRIAEIAQVLKMRVQYYSTSRHWDWESKEVTYVGLNELFSTSDIISIHLPQNAAGKIINEKLIRQMKHGCIFVNTSAGKLVDQETLFEQIKLGRIYAFLDVYEGLPPRKILREFNVMDNLFTYRSAWYTRESIYSKGEMLLNNLTSFFNERGVNDL